MGEERVSTESSVLYVVGAAMTFFYGRDVQGRPGFRIHQRVPWRGWEDAALIDDSFQTLCDARDLLRLRAFYLTCGFVCFIFTSLYLRHRAFYLTCGFVCFILLVRFIVPAASWFHFTCSFVVLAAPSLFSWLRGFSCTQWL